MIVGAAIVEIRIHESHSLKQKRGVVRSIVQRVRNHFNVSVAEVGGQDTWQYAALGVCATGSDRERVRGLIDRTLDFIERLHLAEVIQSDVEILDLPHEEGSRDADEEVVGFEG